MDSRCRHRELLSRNAAFGVPSYAVSEPDFSHAEVERAAPLSPAALRRARGRPRCFRRRRCSPCSQWAWPGPWHLGRRPRLGRGALPACAALVSLHPRRSSGCRSTSGAGYVHERRWGFSTQGLGGWLARPGEGRAISARADGRRSGPASSGSPARCPSAWPPLPRGGGRAACRAPLALSRRSCSSRSSTGSGRSTTSVSPRELRCARRSSRRAGARRARRGREPAHDEGERLRLRSRRHAPRRPLRHAARARRATPESCSSSSRTSSVTAASGTLRLERRLQWEVSWASCSSSGPCFPGRRCWTRSTRPARGRAHCSIRAARRVAPRHRRSSVPGRPVPPVGVRLRPLRDRADRRSRRIRSPPSAGCPRPTCPTRPRRGSLISGSSPTRPCRSAWQRRVRWPRRLRSPA